MKKCPYCAEEIQDEAIVCRFCGRELTITGVPTSQPKEKRKNNTCSIILFASGAIVVLAIILYLGGVIDFVNRQDEPGRMPTVRYNEQPQSNPLAEAKRCVNIVVYKCGDRPRSTVTNQCNKNIWMAEILVTGYTGKGGTKVDADEEYVSDLPVGEDADIEAIFSLDREGRIKYCGAEVTDIVFK